MKLFIAGFFHETLTFSKNETTLENFKERDYNRGADLYKIKKGTKSVMGAYIDSAEKRDVNLVFSLDAATVPSGIVKREVYDVVLDAITEDLRENKEIDGILLNLHGAMVVEGIDDAEASLLKELKELTGFKIPIMAVLDYHANIGADMIKYSDSLVIYKTYPHIDMYECGIEAATLMIETIEGKIRPTAAYRHLPIISPILSQGTYCSPMKDLMDRARSFYQEENILSISLAPGFAYSDIEENGFSVIVITNDDPDLAQQKVDELSDSVWSKRDEFRCNPLPVKEAVKLAMESQSANGPVLLCDSADNPGGGSAGDGVDILRELIDQNVKGALISTLWDPDSAREMHKHKVGESIELHLGGKSPDHENTTLKVEGVILSLTDGSYTYKGPFNTGMHDLIGLTGLLDIQGIKVIVHEHRAQTLDREIIRFTGINPEDQKIIVVKSTIHFRADFEPIASKIIEVDAPGPICPDLLKLDYQKIRRPAFPFDASMTKPF